MGERDGCDPDLKGEALTKALQEHAELGHEYRYRDTLMVQEFYLSMVVLSFALTGISNFAEDAVIKNAILAFGLLVLIILSLHLRNTNQDRVAALKAKAKIAERLGFVNPHLNVTGLMRTSVPPLMLYFTVIAAICWFVWLVVSVAVAIPAKPPAG